MRCHYLLVLSHLFHQLEMLLHHRRQGMALRSDRLIHCCLETGLQMEYYQRHRNHYALERQNPHPILHLLNLRLRHLLMVLQCCLPCRPQLK